MFKEDGSFRFIKFDWEDSSQADILISEKPKCTECQQEFIAKLASLMREKSADDDHKFLCDTNDQRFLSNFIYLCTGQAYVPDMDTEMAKEFAIIVEFNASELQDQECLPKFHSCTNTMCIPFFAYGGDIQKFQEKLAYAMNNCKGSFDMQ